MPGLIENGYVYIAQPRLYKTESGKEECYLLPMRRKTSPQGVGRQEGSRAALTKVWAR